MRKFFTLLAFFTLCGCNLLINAQNLIENWDGNGATGTGSTPGAFGWAGTPTVNWGNANQSGSIRYMDNPSGYTYNGLPWTGRGLCTRWDNVGSANLTTVYSYPVTVVASKIYFFSGKFAWNSNGSGTFKYVIGINSSLDNTGNILHSDTLTITDANRLKFYNDTLTFSPATSGTYYLTIAMPQPGAGNNAIMGMISDLSIVEYSPCHKNLEDQYNTLALSNLANVTANLALPAGTGGVTINWTSSNPSVISNTGVVTRPEKYSTLVTLTANLAATCQGYTTNQTKLFKAIVISVNPLPELLAKWDFGASKISMKNGEVKVGDASGNNLEGTLKDVAGIRTIGKTVKYNVLDLGSNKGYFDMDTAMGAAMYSLRDYTIGAYFRIDSTYAELNNNGNFIWNFSNSANNPADINGYIIGSLKNQSANITSGTYSGDQHLTLNANAAKGSWHHFAYTQHADSGKIYIDGLLATKGLITYLPISTLPVAGRKGTRFNWLGRSCYPSDVYLRQTLIYDFEVYSVPVTAQDWEISFDITGTIASLNKAYKEMPYDTLAELKAELKNLSLGDISAVSSNISLPLVGVLDPSITISWISNDTLFLSNTGILKKQLEYMTKPVVLTAVLAKNGQKVTKSFSVTIAPTPGTGFASDLLLNYNFATNLVNGSTITDAAEKKFTGSLMKGAAVASIGPADNKQDILKLYSDSSYFDMGKECGKLIYGLNDYSVSVYFMVDYKKDNFTKDGNFIYTFSNSDSAGTAKNGYMFGRATKATHCVSSSFWQSGNMSTPDLTPAPSQGVFHHFVFIQSGLVGKVYFDGKLVSTPTSFTNTPMVAIAKSGKSGTLYNWLGRSNYVGDAYLSKALLADFRLYKKAITVDEVNAMQTKTQNLNLAYINDSLPELLSEMKNVDLGDLNHLTSDIALPKNGAVDNSVEITWTSSNPNVITAAGVVTRPDFLNAKVILLATLKKNGQILTKEFPATVIANIGTEYTSDLLLNYNFASNLVIGSTVTDAAEKHFNGTLMNGAIVSSIGKGTKTYNVLDLVSDSSFFDMGNDCGKLMYGLNDYSVSVYFVVDKNKANFSQSGNILYTFSNSNNSNSDKNGYIVGRATDASHAVSSQYYAVGSMQTIAAKNEVSKGDFHHMVFTQQGIVGTTYLDGDTVSSVTSFTNIPSLTLPKVGLSGTLYNWLGKSSYKGDAYLTNAKIADFRVYKKALTVAEIKAMKEMRTNLDEAYKGITPVALIKDVDKLKFDTSIPGLIQIIGLTGTERITIVDMLGRIIVVKDARAISVRPGVYIVKVDHQIAKILVK